MDWGIFPNLPVVFWHAARCPPRANLQEKSFLIFCEKVVDLKGFSVIIGA